MVARVPVGVDDQRGQLDRRLEQVQGGGELLQQAAGQGAEQVGACHQRWCRGVALGRHHHLAAAAEFGQYAIHDAGKGVARR